MNNLFGERLLNYKTVYDYIAEDIDVIRQKKAAKPVEILNDQIDQLLYLQVDAVLNTTSMLLQNTNYSKATKILMLSDNIEDNDSNDVNFENMQDITNNINDRIGKRDTRTEESIQQVLISDRELSHLFFGMKQMNAFQENAFPKLYERHLGRDENVERTKKELWSQKE